VTICGVLTGEHALSECLADHNDRFLVVAALQHNPSQAKGLDTSLQELLHQPFGPLLLGIVALGLFCYGIYSLIEARYRRVGK